MALTQERINKI